MPRFPAPSEARLEALLREAFEFMPGPDMARLAEIELRLLRAAPRPARPRRAAPPWWAILLLAGGAATAAWWAGDALRDQTRGNVRPAPAGAAPEAGASRPAGRAPVQTGAAAAAPAEKTGERIIYQRENP